MAPEAKRARSDDNVRDSVLGLLTAKFEDQRHFLVQLDSKLSAHVADSELKFKVLQTAMDNNTEAIADRLLALEQRGTTSESRGPIQINTAPGQNPAAFTATRVPTAPAVVFKNGERKVLKTFFSNELLEFLRDATVKLSDNQQFVQFCETHNVHAGALLRRLRKVYRGRQFDGAWWWTPGIQRRYPAAPRG